MVKLVKGRTRTGKSGIDYYRYGISLSSSFVDDMGWVDKDIDFEIIKHKDGLLLKIVSMSDRVV